MYSVRNVVKGVTARTLSRSLSNKKVPNRQEWIWSARVSKYLHIEYANVGRDW